MRLFSVPYSSAAINTDVSELLKAPSILGYSIELYNFDHANWKIQINAQSGFSEAIIHNVWMNMNFQNWTIPAHLLIFDTPLLVS